MATIFVGVDFVVVDVVYAVVYVVVVVVNVVVVALLDVTDHNIIGSKVQNYF